MKILFDEDAPHPLMGSLADHDIRTVADMEWTSIKNGELLNRVEAEHFDVFLTGDKNIPKQQDLTGRPFAVLILTAINWTVIRET